MASCQTKQWVATAPVAKLTVTIKSQTDTSATLSWKLQYIAESPSNAVPRPFVAKVNGKTVYNDSYPILNKQGTYTIASGEEKVTKTHSKQSISFNVSVDWKLTWSGTYAGTLSASSSISVGKKTSYTVSYNANGGSGQPSSQPKWHGETLTLSSTKPTRSGYTFVGWGVSTTDTGKNYDPGGNFTANENFTLYAVWSKTITLSYNANGGSGQPSSSSVTVYNATTSNTFTISSIKPTRTGYAFLGWSTSSGATSATYSAGSKITLSANTTLYAVWRLNVFTVTYNANGGTNAPSSQTKTYGTDLVLTSSKPTRQYHNFLGWSTSESGDVVYSAGGTYKNNANITLYAVWEIAYIKPRITGISVTRCDEDGNPQDDGTYAMVKFYWGTDENVVGIKIYWGENSTYTDNYVVSATGTSGRVEQKVGGALEVEKAYGFKIEVADATDYTTFTTSLPATVFPIDMKAGGRGVTIGGPAKEEGFNVEMVSRFKQTTHLEGNTYISNGKWFYGRNTSGELRALVTSNSSNQYTFGNGSYTNNEGSVSFDGNVVNIRSKGAINITSPTAGLTNKPYGVNKVLWGTGNLNESKFMTDAESQTVNLDEAVSQQANGIVLVWSRYTSGAAENSYFNFSFIPKWFADKHKGAGVAVMLTGTPRDTNRIGIKYIYISDTTIKGYAYNDDQISGTDSGINLHGNSYVLRYVIGV